MWYLGHLYMCRFGQSDFSIINNVMIRKNKENPQFRPVSKVTLLKKNVRFIFKSQHAKIAGILYK